MDELIKHLESLGIHVGNNIPIAPRKKVTDQDISLIGGDIIQNRYGIVITVKDQFDVPQHLEEVQPSTILIEWASKGYSPLINRLSDFAILDLETTGMIAGGTIGFLVGIGRIQKGIIEITQYLLTHLEEELAHLFELETILAETPAIVTYNGKSFDIPIISERYTFHHQPNPLASHLHLDLLHFTRKIWKNRLPNRALRTIEADILDIHRDANDIPGWIIPQIYQDFLRSQDISLLQPVIYHNKMDVLSLTVLFLYLSKMIENSSQFELDHPSDRLALAHFFRMQGYIEKAITEYQYCVDHYNTFEITKEALEYLALLYKRQKNMDTALQYWSLAAQMGSLISHVELAKYYEHREGNISLAIDWTQKALALLSSKQIAIFDKLRYEPELKYRMERLIRKLP